MSPVFRCVRCDKELPPGAVFCAFCGERQPQLGIQNKESSEHTGIAKAVSESLVLDAHVLAHVREFLTHLPQQQHSHEWMPRHVLEWNEDDQPLEGHSLLALDQEDVAPEILPPQTMLVENYVLEDVIGVGGMGVVYLARDMAMHRRVAVKVLHANLFRKERMRRRFMREAKLMATLYHANMVSIYELIEKQDLLAIVMQYIPGGSLKQYLAEQNQMLPFSVILDIMVPLLHGVHYAHQRGVIHRDLKPDNILLLSRSSENSTPRSSFPFHPMLTDFGLARVLEGTNFTMSGTLLGTCMYMSPEQFQSHRLLDHKTDIYSLGVVLYQLCTGRCPFHSSNLFALMAAHLQEPPPLPSAFRADLPPALEALILQALHKDPEQRPESCFVLCERLQQSVQE